MIDDLRVDVGGCFYGGLVRSECVHCWLYLFFCAAWVMDMGYGALKIHGTYRDNFMKFRGAIFDCDICIEV